MTPPKVIQAEASTDYIDKPHNQPVRISMEMPGGLCKTIDVKEVKMPIKLHQFQLKQKTEKFSDREQRILNFLTTHPIGVLSSVDPNGEPHGVVIYYQIDRNFHIYFVTRTGTKKYDNLKHSDHVMLTVFEAETQATAQIIGHASEIIDESVNTIAIAGAILSASLKSARGQPPPITKLEEGEYAVFQLIPKQMRMAVYIRPDPGRYEDLFESIESFDLYK